MLPLHQIDFRHVRGKKKTLKQSMKFFCFRCDRLRLANYGLQDFHIWEKVRYLDSFAPRARDRLEDIGESK